MTVYDKTAKAVIYKAAVQCIFLKQFGTHGWHVKLYGYGVNNLNFCCRAWFGPSLCNKIEVASN